MARKALPVAGVFSQRAGDRPGVSAFQTQLCHLILARRKHGDLCRRIRVDGAGTGRHVDTRSAA